ncbi:iron-containing alcohol dehydrogenase [Halomonas sp. MCCC 1A17488]|uniref:iron-containing alcohol dehydrogenase n=1 Tax=unclassified Halomonas TaxID=2609666 RepID=UPI0018D24AEA|nr:MULTISPECIES: iron-containing alcohol dehydrogenase [unclassified Halomonas]MCE8016251.1 iron-containing alcohol dehydrogenase [Halomonas sp. MCCC 1A17488]MCG3239584.1 iron-containing alcohol dehydrogenase [Halomonas sp. MCCC 1A17488]QPP50501.1 iron-containing alcohol dehydrogenase [Halomonas sp. SS10-MC5]
MLSYEFNTTRKLVVEQGAAACLHEVVSQFSAKRIFLITDPGISDLGLHEPSVSGLTEHGASVEVFDGVVADPPETVVLEAIEQARQMRAELIIGFGGGSSMDVAKLVAYFAHPHCRQPLQEAYGIGKIQADRLPLVQVPTTAGTGSEVTPISIVTTGETTKSGIVSPVLLPDVAVLDAGLTVGLPRHVTAATGIDAMVHAIEAYTSKIRKNPMSDMLAKEALRLLVGHIDRVLQDGNDLDARQSMLLGSCLAGQAFANAPVAAVHALAYPLGGHYHVPHGLSNALVLPAVLRFNAVAAAEHYAELAPILTREPRSSSVADDCERFIVGIETLLKGSGLPLRLRDVGVHETALGALAADAMQQQRLLINNPRDVTEQDALEIYQTVY